MSLGFWCYFTIFIKWQQFRTYRSIQNVGQNFFSLFVEPDELPSLRGSVPVFWVLRCSPPYMDMWSPLWWLTSRVPTPTNRRFPPPVRCVCWPNPSEFGYVRGPDILSHIVHFGSCPISLKCSRQAPLMFISGLKFQSAFISSTALL